MDDKFRGPFRTLLNAIEDIVASADSSDLCSVDAIRFVNIGKQIEYKIGKEGELIVNKPFDI